MAADASRLSDTTTPARRGRAALWLAVAAGGAAGLTWEVLWQHYASLTLGISAFGTAVTLAALMLGLGLGGLVAAWLARTGRVHQPLRAYGIAELVVGLAGVCVPVGMNALAALDTVVYAHSPELADLLHALGVGLLLLIPAAAMGTTLPLLAAWVRRVGTSLPALYALNTAGAVLGVVLVTFAALPLLGVRATSWLGATIDVAVGLWAIARSEPMEAAPASPAASGWPAPRALVLAFGSAFVVFVLEVSWFRSLRAALAATTETFSVLIAAFLVGLTLGASCAPRLRARFAAALPLVLALAGFAVLYATSAVDQLDLSTTGDSASPLTPFVRFGAVLAIAIVPVTLLGVPFPWLLADCAGTAAAGRLYALNTLGAVSGSLLSGFVLLPRVGASATSWLAGAVACALALVAARTRLALLCALLAAALGGGLALIRHDGGARARVQGFASHDFTEVAFVAEGPDSTVWVTRERRSQRRALVIDGFQASGEGPGTAYMAWMGHLPALATPALRNALVICFGTGQTAHAVRVHRPEQLTIVDINPNVFQAAPFFAQNHGVLQDPSVRSVVMDGRAYLRRHPDARFDLITLEPMPPNHAGVNNLYSREFYQLVRSRLSPRGSVAQWLPIHLIAARHMRAIIATFVQAFPHARLWMDSEGTGVLVANLTPWSLRLGQQALPLSAAEVQSHFLLDADALRSLSRGQPLVTDDNQLLSYGLDRLSRSARRGRTWSNRLAKENRAILDEYAARISEAR